MRLKCKSGRSPPLFFEKNINDRGLDVNEKRFSPWHGVLGQPFSYINLMSDPPTPYGGAADDDRFVVRLTPGSGTQKAPSLAPLYFRIDNKLI